MLLLDYMRISSGAFSSVLESALLPILELNKKSFDSFVSLEFSLNQILINFDSNSLRFSTIVVATSNPSSASPPPNTTNRVVVVILKDLVHLFRLCSDTIYQELELDVSEESLLLKSVDGNFEVEIQTVEKNVLENIDEINILEFSIDSEILFSAFHQFSISPICRTICVAITSDGIKFSNNDEEQLPLKTSAEIARQYLFDNSINIDNSINNIFSINGKNISTICAFLSAGGGAGKCSVFITSCSYLRLRRHLFGQMDIHVSLVN